MHVNHNSLPNNGLLFAVNKFQGQLRKQNSVERVCTPGLVFIFPQLTAASKQLVMLITHIGAARDGVSERSADNLVS